MFVLNFDGFQKEVTHPLILRNVLLTLYHPFTSFPCETSRACAKVPLPGSSVGLTESTIYAWLCITIILPLKS